MPQNSLEYSQYLQLDRIINAQQPQSALRHDPKHDEMLFIITHQTYELWFKQILIELNSITKIMSEEVIAEKALSIIVSRSQRINKIQQLLLKHIDVLETMSAMDFLDFRQYLGSASGFQSEQFREIEIILGLEPKIIEKLLQAMPQHSQKRLNALIQKPSLFDHVTRWLSKMPFLEFEEFNFWEYYRQAIEEMMQKEKDLLVKHTYLNDEERKQRLAMLTETYQQCLGLMDPAEYTRWQQQGQFRMPQRALVSALFIFLYRHEPILHLPYTFLSQLLDIDEYFNSWRTRHLEMAQRMIGNKMGTGGSSGCQYLKHSIERSRVYGDLLSMANFIVPQSSLPPLPKKLVRALDFQFNAEMVS